MSPDFSPELQQELLDDFFTECDEHLTNIRQALVQLEPSIDKAQADLTVVEDLFRNFHSFKGISAIVGLRAAEELAHATEDYLRDLSRGKRGVSQEGLDLLMSSAQRLEQIVMAFRSKGPIPDAGALKAGLKQMCGRKHWGTEIHRKDGMNPQSSSGAPNAPQTAEDARSRGLILWKCTFVPNRALDDRGVNITSVRARLEQAGEILKASPQIKGQGSVAFEFLVGMKETPGDIMAWEADGISAELMDLGPETPVAPIEAAPVVPTAEINDNPFIAPSHVVRVDLQRLDELMRITGEMVIQRSRFEEAIKLSVRKGQSVDWSSLQEVNVGLGRSLRELREAIMRVRLVSVAEIFARMPFVVRDLARDSSKKVQLKLDGQQTAIDKYLIEQLKDPLLHLVRNAFSHGVETPRERIAAGKPEQATILLKASNVGDSVVVEVRDDGRGIDRAEVARHAAPLGLELPKSASDAELLRVLCSPGFSTRASADRASGRGVGMAVVHNKVRELGGQLTLESTAGEGTRFIIRLPMTLAIADAFIVSASDQTCAVPQNLVSEVMQVTAEEIRKVNGVEAVPYRSGVLPVVRLSAFFGLPQKTTPRMCLLVITSDRGSAGLLVDGIQGQREVVVRAMRDPLLQVVGVSGATELGDGRPVLILDGAALTSGVVRPPADALALERN